MASQDMNNMPVEQQDTSSWASPAEHFRTRHKWLTLYTDKNFNINSWLSFKTWVLDRSYVPWFTPLYFGMLHISQRNRNLFLVENHMNYRPYWGRRNTEDSTYDEASPSSRAAAAAGGGLCLTAHPTARPPGVRDKAKTDYEMKTKIKKTRW
eukprot:CAMPEP_0174831504 /NCGR_PEP_ID=MMETSP1114-20130205/3131_1 /TAXON_ID=312471 /ORGANISM="Neobodo designis, Strain CCAP 1951/1" /LENGTH=151 /DNA_ID=CAMNT_0016065329 /DNA_START=34 /DNA_END=487 /DNA_ORIENTATION=-